MVLAGTFIMTVLKPELGGQGFFDDNTVEESPSRPTMDTRICIDLDGVLDEKVSEGLAASFIRREPRLSMDVWAHLKFVNKRRLERVSVEGRMLPKSFRPSHHLDLEDKIQHEQKTRRDETIDSDSVDTLIPLPSENFLRDALLQKWETGLRLEDKILILFLSEADLD